MEQQNETIEREKYLVAFNLRKPNDPLERQALHRAIIKLKNLLRAFELDFKAAEDDEQYVFSVSATDDSMEVGMAAKAFLDTKESTNQTATEALKSVGYESETQPDEKLLFDYTLREVPTAAIQRVKELCAKFLIIPFNSFGQLIDGDQPTESAKATQEEELDGGSESKV